MCKKLILLFLFVIVISLTLNATTLTKKTGEVITGEIINFDNNTVTIKTAQGEVRVMLADLNPISQFKVKQQFMNQDNPDEHLKLAQFCIENELFEDAISSIILAGEISDKIIERAVIMLRRSRLLHADKLRQEAKILKDGRRYVDALSLYLQLYKEYSDSEDINAIKREIQALQSVLGLQKVLPPIIPQPSLLQRNLDDKKPPAKKDKPEPELTSAQIRRLTRYKDNFDKAKNLIEDAIQFNKTARLRCLQTEYNDKVNSYIRAEKNYLDAKLIIEQLIQREEDWFSYLIEEAKLVINDQIIPGLTEVARDMMHLFIEKSPNRPDYQSSLRWLNKVLAYSPYDEKARELRTSITENILKEARK